MVKGKRGRVGGIICCKSRLRRLSTRRMDRLSRDGLSENNKNNKNTTTACDSVAEGTKAFHGPHLWR